MAKIIITKIASETRQNHHYSIVSFIKKACKILKETRFAAEYPQGANAFFLQFFRLFFRSRKPYTFG
jgi:hypothetical protein